MDIAAQAGNIFDRSQNLELKRLLLKFVFEGLTLTEGVLSYKLKFPFNEFVNANILMARAAQTCEPNQTLMNQGLQENDNENLQIGSLKSYELAESQKNVRLAKNSASLLQIGDPNGTTQCKALLGTTAAKLVSNAIAFSLTKRLRCSCRQKGKTLCLFA